MKFTTVIPAALFTLLPLAAAAPLYDSAHISPALPSPANEDTSKKPWQVYSMREQPFDNALLRFTLLDPNTQYETDCETSLPMSGYANCKDGSTSFIYGGVSYQYGETWLSIQRKDVQDCTDGVLSCKNRGASGTLNLPNNFWQQPGWNSWVHPEALDLHWGWSS